MPITGIKTSIASAFTTPEYALPVSSFDDELTADDICSIRLWDSNLYPAQNSSFIGMQNAVAGRGANTYQAPGGGTAAFLGGALDFADSGMAGVPGIKIGVAATGGVPHVNDLSTLPDDTEFLTTQIFKVESAALGANALTMACQTDSGVVLATGKMQWAHIISNVGLAIYLAGSTVQTGWIPVQNKVYIIGVHFKPNVAGTSEVLLYAYNVTDSALVIDGASYNLTGRAMAAMVNGGTALGCGYNWTGQAAPSGFRTHGLTLEVLRDSTDPVERFGDRLRQAKAAFAATLIS